MTRTIAAEAQSVTMRDVLFAEDGTHPASQSLVERLHRAGALDVVREATRELAQDVAEEVEARIGELADEMLGKPVTDAIVQGWRGYQALTDTAQASLRNPDAVQLVPLAAHHLTHVDDWALEVLIAELPAATLRCCLEVTADIDAALAVIRAGDLVGIRGGRCDLQITLTAENHLIAERKQHLQLSQQFALRSHVALAAPPAS